MTKLATYIQVAQAHGVQADLLPCCQHSYGRQTADDSGQGGVSRSWPRQPSTGTGRFTSMQSTQSTRRGRQTGTSQYTPPSTGGPASTAGTCPDEYPLLEQPHNDNQVRIGTRLALSNMRTPRHLILSDDSPTTSSGLPCVGLRGFSRDTPTPAEAWWQVMPAHDQVLQSSTIVHYGTQIRLRHISTHRHLHSQSDMLIRDTDMQQVIGFDRQQTDANDHWIVERGDGQPMRDSDVWLGTIPLTLRHAQTGRVLTVMQENNLQSVVCAHDSGQEQDKWQLMFR